MSDATIFNEAEKLKSEIEVGKSIIEGARNKYADELGESDTIKNMRTMAAVKPKTYKIPRKVRRRNKKEGTGFLKKIMILFGL